MNPLKTIFLLCCCLTTFCCLGVKAQTSFGLEHYLSAASDNSPLLKDYNNQTKNSEFEVERLKALYNRSQLSFDANLLVVPIMNRDNGGNKFQLNGQSANDYYGYSLSQTTGSLSAQINWVKPLLNTSFKASEQRIHADQAIVQNNIKMARHDLEKLITDQYILCLLDQAQIDFVDSLTTILSNQLEVSQKMASNNLLKQSDLRLLSIEISSNQELGTTCRQAYYSDLLDLNIICGLKDTTKVTLQELSLEPKMELPSLSSNYLTQYVLDSSNASLQQLEFESKYKPQLNAFASAGLLTSYLKNIPQRFGTSGGLSFSWALFDGHQKDITRKQTALTINTANEYKNSFIATNEVRKHKYISEIKTYSQRKQLLESQINEYSLVMSDYQKQMNAGQVSVLDYITVLKSRIQVVNSYLLLNTNRLLLINNYNYWNW